MASHQRTTARSPYLLTLALAVALGAPALSGCEEEEPINLGEPPLDPIEQRAALTWVVRADDPAAWQAAADHVDRYRPSGVVLGGALQPVPGDALSPGSLAFDDALAFFDALEGPAGSVELSLGVELPSLPADAPETLCFDPNDPTTDPFLAGQAGVLSDFLEARAGIDAVLLDFDAPARPWEVDCACVPCEGDGALGPARRVRTAFELSRAEAEAQGVDAWWWDRAPLQFDPDALAPGTADGYGPNALDSALGQLGGDRGLLVRVGPTRTSEQPWASPHPGLSRGLTQRVGADIELLPTWADPRGLPLLFPDLLHDRMRLQREEGVLSWFINLDDGSRSVWGTPSEAQVYWTERLFREFEASPEALLAGWVEERYGLAADSLENRRLSGALRPLGRALALAVHPLGLTWSGGTRAVPTDVDIAALDISPWFGEWLSRVDLADDLDRETFVAVHQWTREGELLADAAAVTFNEVRSELSPADGDELAEQILRLRMTTRSWGAIQRARVARAVAAASEFPDDELDSWLRWEAETLLLVADSIDAELGSGALASLGGLDPDGLRALSTGVLEGVPAGPALRPPLPVITEVGWDFEDDRVNVDWRLDPGGDSWLEWGPGAPIYDDMSSVGEGPNENWHAWLTTLAGGSRFSFRACGEVNGTTVCSADQVLWVPR